MGRLVFMLIVLAAFVILGLAMTLSIKKHEAKMKNVRKKKGRSRYMPEYKKPGK